MNEKETMVIILSNIQNYGDRLFLKIP